MQGIDEIIPVDVYVPGCPPSPEALIAAVMKIQERIKSGEQAKAPQGAHRLGVPGEGTLDRRARRAAWARDDAARAEQGLPPRGVIPLRVIDTPAGHGQAPHGADPGARPEGQQGPDVSGRNARG
jgi:hypothetical protein